MDLKTLPKALLGTAYTEFVLLVDTCLPELPTCENALRLAQRLAREWPQYPLQHWLAAMGSLYTPLRCPSCRKGAAA